MTIVFDVLKAILDIVTKFAQPILQLLPKSPFKGFINDLAGLPYIGILNWFFPVGFCLSVMAVWLTCVGVYYIYSIILRWLKVIGD